MFFVVIVPFGLVMVGLAIWSLLVLLYMICYVLWSIVSYPFRDRTPEPPLLQKPDTVFPIDYSWTDVSPSTNLTLAPTHHLVADPKYRWRTSYGQYDRQ